MGSVPYEAFMDYCHLETNVFGIEDRNRPGFVDKLRTEVEEKLKSKRGYRQGYEIIGGARNLLMKTFYGEHSNPKWKNMNPKDFQKTDEYKEFIRRTLSWTELVLLATASKLEKKAK